MNVQLRVLPLIYIKKLSLQKVQFFFYCQWYFTKQNLFIENHFIISNPKLTRIRSKDWLESAGRLRASKSSAQRKTQWGQVNITIHPFKYQQNIPFDLIPFIRQSTIKKPRRRQRTWNSIFWMMSTWLYTVQVIV